MTFRQTEWQKSISVIVIQIVISKTGSESWATLHDISLYINIRKIIYFRNLILRTTLQKFRIFYLYPQQFVIISFREPARRKRQQDTCILDCCSSELCHHIQKYGDVCQCVWSVNYKPLTVNYLKVAKEQEVLLISTETDKILSNKFHFGASTFHPTYRRTHRNISLGLIVFVGSDVIRNENIMRFR